MIEVRLQSWSKLVVVVGPTAAGKSALAVRLAKRFSGEIVSADSRQIYRGLEIGSNAPSARERQGIRHHLVGIADPRRQIRWFRRNPDIR